ncbi:MAG: F0F1 ATP synthase subunit A [Clostridiales bacterium]|jgi:F-type H+-transporting ATPase subunit a|nr:F0F1 ATP synthase subunit A [Clostridiales bacterium]
MDFSNKKLAILFRVGDANVYLTNTLVSTWTIGLVLIALAFVLRLMYMKRYQDAPASGSLQNVLELAVETMSNFVTSTLGHNLTGLGGYFFGVFVFIIISNFSALVGLRPPTADLSTTLALALNTFFLTHFLGITRQQGEYFKEYVNPVFIFLPIHLIGEISKPISLSFRLFGNILGGVIILGLLYKALPILLRFAVPDVLHLYFDLFAGSLQAYIFTILSMTYIRSKAEGSE